MQVGRIININNREGIICFVGTLEGINYINVCFDDENEYKIYSVKKDGEDFILKSESNPNTIASLMAIWASEELDNISEEQE
jgi:hypothetical protein